MARVNHCFLKPAAEMLQATCQVAGDEPMKTILHAYNLDTSKPEDAKAYAELCKRLKDWPHQMKSHGGGRTSYYFGIGQQLDGKTIELETAFLFNNQWNTAPFPGSEKGWRVFDWAEDAIFTDNGSENLRTRRGYWLEQTAEMREIRRNTNVCGYCGKYQPAANGAVFCDKCLDSPYLKASELHLLRMVAADESGKPQYHRAPLTEAESAYLLPLYREAQLHGSTERGKARIAKERADLEAEYLKTTAAAKTKRDGFLWLMDHGINTENCIYYNHTDRFSFGWRQPVDKEAESAILDVISEFPFAYEIKTADGRKLETTT
jgi:hypothetical protein